MGHYRRDTVENNRAIDWHRISLALKYVGTMLCMTDPIAARIAKEQMLKLHYGLVVREFATLGRSPWIIKHPKKDKVWTFYHDLMAKSFEYYKFGKVDEILSARMQHVRHLVKLPDDYKIKDFDLQVVRAMYERPQKSIELSLKTYGDEQYDIYVPGKSSDTFAKRISRYKIKFSLSAIRAAELMLEMHYSQVWNNHYAQLVQSVVSRGDIMDYMSETERIVQYNDIYTCFPANFASLTLRLLVHFSGDTRKAYEKWFDLLASHGFMFNRKTDPDPDKAFNDFIRTEAGLSMSLKIVKRAHLQYFNHQQIPQHFLLITRPLADNESYLEYLLGSLWKRKRNFWLAHYNGRLTQTKTTLTNKPDLKHNSKFMTKLIYYQWMIKWLPYVKVRLEDIGHVFPYIEDGDAIRLLQEVDQALSRKRNFPILNYHQYGTVGSLLTAIGDRFIHPKRDLVEVKYYYRKINETFRYMVGDIAKMLRVAMFDAEGKENELEEYEEDILHLDNDEENILDIENDQELDDDLKESMGDAPILEVKKPASKNLGSSGFNMMSFSLGFAKIEDIIDLTLELKEGYGYNLDYEAICLACDVDPSQVHRFPFPKLEQAKELATEQMNEQFLRRLANVDVDDDEQDVHYDIKK